MFTAALERVAVLNGIPREERSWRHSSIASRARFLVSLSGDPGRAHRFQRLVRRIKAALVLVAVGGTIATALYVWDHPLYGIGKGGRASGPDAPARTPRQVPSGNVSDVGMHH